MYEHLCLLSTQNGPSDWLIVDKHVVDLGGKTCNKIGSSFTAFRTQENACSQDQQSCLHNQPLDLWTDDEVCFEARNHACGYVCMYGSWLCEIGLGLFVQ